jgi:adenylate cyclase
MFSKDRIAIRYNRLITNFTFHFIFWELALVFYVFLLGGQNIFAQYPDAIKIDSIYLFVTFISIVTSLLFTLIDVLFSDWLIRLLPAGFLVFFKSLLYFASGFFVILAAAIPTLNWLVTDDYAELLIDLPTNNNNLLRFLVFFYVSCFMNNLFKGIRKKIGPENYLRWMFGFMNKPNEEERIFMFIDLKGSTTHAEKLGHRKFSRLCQDVFNDMAIVDNYKGDIYQYLGDGAIVSWNVKNGLKNLNFIQSFFAFEQLIHKRRRYYQRKFGFIPQFKAGIHVGKVMVLQVGKIRRDISYNGDTMNTAARIESKCNELRQKLLISADLYALIPDKKTFRYKNMGGIELRGKRKAVEVYAINKKS